MHLDAATVRGHLEEKQDKLPNSDQLRIFVLQAVGKGVNYCRRES